MPQAGAARAVNLALHRPERVWPVRPRPGPIPLSAPPAPPDTGGGGLLSGLLPMVGSLSIVAFAFVIHSLIYLVVIAVMVVVMVGAGLATQMSQRRREGRRWAATKDRYRRHVEAVRFHAAGEAAVQCAGLQGLFPSMAEVLELVRQGEGIWERRPDDDDFGAVRLGLGGVPAARPVVMAQADSPLVDPDPELGALADDLVEASSALPAAPVVLPLASLGTVAVVGPSECSQGLVGSWLASLAAFHAPGELRVAGLVPVGATRVWDWVKWLPHSRDPQGGEGFGRAKRAVTTDLDSFAEQLRQLVRPRMEQLGRAAEAGLGRGGARVGGDHVVVVIDGWHPDAPVAQVRDLDVLMANADALRATVVVLAPTAADVPTTCGARVDVASDGTATYVESGQDGRIETDVLADGTDLDLAHDLARRLAPLHLADGGMEADEADTVRLAELLGAEDPGQLEVSRSWLTTAALTRGSASSLLQAPVGLRRDGDALVLDLKEAAEGGMGPHGMIVGATGSGKSELLRSLLAALAARHAPDLLSFLLVDFKGGAAFSELAELPHVAGLVTNLADDMALVERVEQALRGELDRRQELLRSEGNLDSIRQYHAACAAEGRASEMSYLVIVVDEFGELLVARPEFLDTFLAIGRLGRSLGMHLVLSTQRLDEGRIRGLEPHLRYRIGLRTYTAVESRAILGSPAAFELPALPGLGYLKVDTVMQRFKAGLVSLPHRPAERLDRDRLVTPLLRPLSLTPPSLGNAPAGAPSGPHSDLSVLARRIKDAAGTHRARPVWLDPLPDALTMGQVEQRFPPAPGSIGLRATLGVIDLPERQSQHPLVLELSGSGGNLGIVGAPRTGKSALVRSLVLSLCSVRSPAEVQLYCLDLGGGSLFGLAQLPQVGAVVGRGELEAAERLLRELQALIDERATLFRQLEVASVEELRDRLQHRDDPWATTSLRAAHVLCVIDNVGLLRQVLPELEPVVGELAVSGLQYGIHVVLTANRWLDVRPQLLDALGSRLELHLGDPLESAVSRAASAALPADRPGRGLTRDGHLFQAAMPSFDLDPGTGESGTLAGATERAMSASSGLRAPALSSLRERISAEDVPALALSAGSEPPAPGGGFLLGVAEFRSRPVQIDLMGRSSHLLVLGDSGSGRSTVLRRATRHLCSAAPPELVRLHLVDPARGLVGLADDAHVQSYAPSLSAAEKVALDLAGVLEARLPPDELSLAQLRTGSWWEGPQHVLVIDDYDLALSAMGGPFGCLVDLLGMAGDIGFHVLLARRVAGAQRSIFEPFGQRLREVGTTGLVLSGVSDEGPLLGGVTPRALPPGRGFLVTRGAKPVLVQCCYDENEQAAV